MDLRPDPGAVPPRIQNPGMAQQLRNEWGTVGLVALGILLAVLI
jgi:hypothetical protein